MNFTKSIQKKVAATSPIIVGIDPDVDLMSYAWLSKFEIKENQVKNENHNEKINLRVLAEIYLAYSKIIVKAVAGLVPAIKIQIAFFEVLGSQGISLVEQIIQFAKEHDLLVVLDGKRGDVPSTAKQYAEAYLGDSPLSSDATTLNPYLGMDSLDPFLTLAEKKSKGVFICLKTSNPGSGDLQDLTVDKEPLYLNLAKKLLPYEASGSLGVVVGATYPEEAKAIRGILKEAIFLVPGLGHQGGRLEDAKFYFNSEGKNALFNFSRAIIFPKISLNHLNISSQQLENLIRDNLLAQIKKLN